MSKPKAAPKRAAKKRSTEKETPTVERSTGVIATIKEHLERAGVPRSTAMKLTGHLTEAVYRRYAIVSEADLGEGVAKLAALSAATTAATANGAS
jgi:hypothetical protein